MLVSSQTHPSGRRRVVITGFGALTNLGTSAAATWAGMREGRSGISTIEGDEFKAYSGTWDVTIAGQIKGWDPTSVIEFREAKRLDRFCHLALAAAVGVAALEHVRGGRRRTARGRRPRHRSRLVGAVVGDDDEAVARAQVAQHVGDGRGDAGGLVVGRDHHGHAQRRRCRRRAPAPRQAAEPTHAPAKPAATTPAPAPAKTPAPAPAKTPPPSKAPAPAKAEKKANKAAKILTKHVPRTRGLKRDVLADVGEARLRGREAALTKHVPRTRGLKRE